MGRVKDVLIGLSEDLDSASSAVLSGDITLAIAKVEGVLAGLKLLAGGGRK
jgi:hypothetical protein